MPCVRAAVLNGCCLVLRRRGIARRAGLAHRASHGDETTTLASAESEVILSESRRQVLSALARLPRRRREVLMLRYYHYLLLAYTSPNGLVSGWIDHGKLRFLPARHPDSGLPITAW